MSRHAASPRSPGSIHRGIVLALACGALCVVGCGGAITPEQKDAMAKLQNLGGRIDFRQGGYKVDLTKTPVEDKDLVHLQRVPKLKILDLQGLQITDEGLKFIEPIDTLELVFLQRTLATKEGVEALRKSHPKADIQF